MSCGKPHATDCRTVLETVFLYLDGECESEQRDKVKEHLEECGPCLREYGIEADVKALVARCCRDRAPDGLKERVLGKLREAGIDG